MRGELIAVWSETWREIWFPLIDKEDIPEDIFCELYRELAKALRSPPSAQDLADIIDDPMQSRKAFENASSADFGGERGLVGFFEGAHEALEGLGGDNLTNRYFNLLTTFIDKYSLRYDLRRPCVLCPTLPGLITNLIQHVRSTSQADTHLAKLVHEYEEAIRDLKHGRTEARIKSCLTKQYILIEGIANARSGTTGETLGQRCGQASWPHPTLRAAAGNIYGFRSDYPGLGHSGNPNAVLRDVDDRELAGVSCMLLGVVPYVDSSVDMSSLYGSRALVRGGDSGQDTKPLPAVRDRSTWNKFSSWIGRLFGVQ
jgi:hypothetical protein